MILAIETSCDETAAAVVDRAGVLRSSVVSSQAELHAPYGGVVPEVASRRHLELTVPVVAARWPKRAPRSTTSTRSPSPSGPGLIGALLVGVAAAKALAFSRRLPLIAVDHLHGHIASLYLAPRPLEPPFLCLLASGGHTLLAEVDDRRGYRVIGSTLDDAAGEAFDKGARLLGLGYPGGALLEAAGAGRRPGSVRPPRSRCSAGPGHDLSFSGLKTALLYAVQAVADVDGRRADLAASYQRAIVRSLVGRTMEALAATGRGRWPWSAGWPRTARCARRSPTPARGTGVRLALAPPALCSDNAAMIASAARFTQPIPFPRLPRPRRATRRARHESVEVVLYGAPDCQLCDEAKRQLLEPQAAVSATSSAPSTSAATPSSSSAPPRDPGCLRRRAAGVQIPGRARRAAPPGDRRSVTMRRLKSAASWHAEPASRGASLH